MIDKQRVSGYNLQQLENRQDAKSVTDQRDDCCCSAAGDSGIHSLLRRPFDEESISYPMLLIRVQLMLMLPLL